MNTKSQIKLFEIENLFNQFNVCLPLDNSVNIFLGENGMGKTTVLNCFYYALSGELEKLGSVIFRKIRLLFHDGTNLEISSNDIMAYIETTYDMQFRRRRVNIEKMFTKKDMEILRDIYAQQDEDMEPRLIRYVSRVSDILGVPFRYAEQELKRLVFSNFQEFKKGDPNKAISFKKAIEEKVQEEILYFPTYRRIEEDLSKLGIEIEKEKVNNRLIQFGMTDVKTVIEKMLATIKSASITSFTQMTGILLKQYLQGDLTLDTQYKVNKEKLNIALDRIGDEIENEDKQRIKDLVSTEDIYNPNYIYLLNLIKNLILSYDKQSQYDEKVKSFANTCNNYLNDKKYRYDESNVELNIYRDRVDNRQPIAIQNLSSGEKQVISIFAKLYLEKNESCIILFDEPELSLSIKWQTSFLPDIMKTGKCSKLIAVTHSPFIFDNEFDELATSMANCIQENKGRND